MKLVWLLVVLVALVPVAATAESMTDAEVRQAPLSVGYATN